MRIRFGSAPAGAASNSDMRASAAAAPGAAPPSRRASLAARLSGGSEGRTRASRSTSARTGARAERARSGEHSHRWASPPSSRTRPISAAARRDLPIPGGPFSRSVRPRPAMASAQAPSRTAVSRPRPRRGPSARSARPDGPGPITRWTARTPSKPLSRRRPNGSVSMRPRRSRCVAAEISTRPGSAAAWRRAARFGASPITASGSSSPRSASPPTTARPVASPARIASRRPSGARIAPAASRTASAARTARSASSSRASGQPKA